MKIKLKNICSVLLIMACMFTLTSCKEVENAEKAVTDFMTAIQNCDYETMASIGNGMDADKIDTTDEQGKQIFDNLFNKTTYEIKSAELQEDKSVLVTTDITTVDVGKAYSTAITNSFSQLLSNAFSGEELSDEESEQIIIDNLVNELNNSNTGTVTTTVNIKVLKVDKTWKVDCDDAFINAITGNLKSTLQNTVPSTNLIIETDKSLY